MAQKHTVTFGQLKKKLDRVMEFEELKHFLADETEGIVFSEKDMKAIDIILENALYEINEYVADKLSKVRDEICYTLRDNSLLPDGYLSSLRDYAQKKIEEGDERYADIVKMIEG